MSQWVCRGIKTRIKTTHYPAQAETAPGVSPGLPLGGAYAAAVASLVNLCPTKAISPGLVKDSLIVDYRRCIHCFRCVRGATTPMRWDQGWQWAADGQKCDSIAPGSEGNRLSRVFAHSVHIIVVDAGDCGACLNEVKQLNNPYYNMHRLGFFLTPTPRHADILLVVGPVTEHMRLPLLKTYEAMPTPKRVIAVGACALSGGVFGPSFVSGAGVAQTLPVDVQVPGHPPPPLAILHGLLVAVGRQTPASITSPAPILPEATTR